jgi:hypothetical protein
MKPEARLRAALEVPLDVLGEFFQLDELLAQDALDDASMRTAYCERFSILLTCALT